MKKSLSILFIILFTFISIYSEDKIIFKWSFFKKKGNKYESVDFKNNKLAKGDQFKIFLKPIKNVYLYLFSLDSENNLIPLFPENPDFFNKDYKFEQSYYIPNIDDWFIIEGSGTEKFYLLASSERLKKLESFTKEFIKLSEKLTNSEKFAELKENILDEINGLKKQYSQYKVYAEKPTAIAGVSRSLENDIKDLVIQVEAEKFYGKILRIEH